MLFVSFLAECFREDVFKHILADSVLEAAFDDAGGGFSGPEAGQISFLADVGNDVFRLVVDLVQRDNDLDFVLAAFNEGHVRVLRSLGFGWSLADAQVCATTKSYSKLF